MVSHSFALAVVALICSTQPGVNAWSMRSPPQGTAAKKSSVAKQPTFWNPQSVFASMAAAAVIFSYSPVLVDEYGVEKEAPTLFTGETVVLRCRC